MATRATLPDSTRYLMDSDTFRTHHWLCMFPPTMWHVWVCRIVINLRFATESISRFNQLPCVNNTTCGFLPKCVRACWYAVQQHHPEGDIAIRQHFCKHCLSVNSNKQRIDVCLLNHLTALKNSSAASPGVVSGSSFNGNWTVHHGTALPGGKRGIIVPETRNYRILGEIIVLSSWPKLQAYCCALFKYRACTTKSDFSFARLTPGFRYWMAAHFLLG